MDPNTGTPDLLPQGEPIHMDQLAETVRSIVISEPASARGGELLQLLRLRDNLPQGMTLAQRTEADAIFDRAFRVFDRALGSVPMILRREWLDVFPQPISARSTEELRQIVLDFARDELVGNVDAHRMVGAMARLFQGPLANHPDSGIASLEVMFSHELGVPARSALSRLFCAYLDRSTRRIEEISQRVLDNDTHFQFTRSGGVLIVNENPPYPLSDDDSDIDTYSDRDGDPNSDSDSNHDGDEYSILNWLALSTITLPDPPPQEFGLEAESRASLSNFRRDVVDLSYLKDALRDYGSQLMRMFTGRVAYNDLHTWRRLRNDINNFSPFGLLTLQNLEDVVAQEEYGHRDAETVISEVRQLLDWSETILSWSHKRLFDAERDIIAREESLLDEGQTLEAYSSRYERTRYRYRLKSLVAGFRNQRYRDLFSFPSTVQPAPIARPYETGDPCPICYDVLERTEGMSSHAEVEYGAYSGLKLKLPSHIYDHAYTRMAERRKRGRPRTEAKYDNWFGVEDARERKRIQDRLAQRTRRDRLLGRPPPSKVGSAGAGDIATQPESSSDASTSVQTVPSEPPAAELDLWPSSREDAPLLARLPGMRFETMRAPPSVLAIAMKLPTDHYFLCWPAWPLYSALLQHGLMQGTGCPDANDEVASPREYLALPEPLRPTALQLALPHRRWIDRFPFPRLRNNLILLNGLVDLDEFVRDLFGMASLLLRPDLRRATWEPESWRMGTEFSLKWGYLFL
ncbi:hypothetical protein PV04_06462 [Phialophora macrospora]|uniref:Uncharacterized protein n=1 Tax=Phialophora macrospora TaxID=1851006 RepID=A0A0D2G597_9EURO|nr:hypothetical protein PV04_06462 [Phialophora macrospora]